MELPFITDIQHYSIHDGTGIRTTVFFKGCPLRCQWCHNPETQSFNPELLFREERCNGCGACLSCRNDANSLDEEMQAAVINREKCTACGACAQECYHEARELCGRQRSLQELIKELEKDIPFYETSGGGVTLSGGEVMSQNSDYIMSLCCQLRKKGISVNMDTSGYALYSAFEPFLPLVDTFLYDIKAWNPQKHKRLTGVDNHLILDNLCRLSDDGAKLWIRLPLIAGVNDSTQEIEEIGMFLKNIQLQQINLLPYHNTGSGKYGCLGIRYSGEKFQAPSQKHIHELALQFKKMGLGPVYIGG